MHKSRTRIGLAATAALVLSAGLTAAAIPAQAAPSTTLVVSEVYGGGGNSGATYTNDFIELQNVGSTDLGVDGYSVQYISAAPGPTTLWSVTGLSGSVTAGKHYLVQEGKGTGGTTALPSPDATGAIAMSASAGTVALVQGTTALSCKTAADCAADSRIVDLVGYGTAAIREGSDAPGLGNTTSDSRSSAGTDTDDNSTDFTAGAPDPQNSGAVTPPPPPPTSATVDEVQGNGFLSPYSGQSVADVAGIVTALKSNGFWMQQVADVDSDPATSEGIFVFTSSTPTVAVGDSITVAARVSEFDPGAAHASTSNLTITELTGPTITEMSQGNALPAPIVLGPDTVPDTYAFDNGASSIEPLTIDPNRSALDYYESIEGMLAEVDNARVVGPSNDFGEQYVTTKPDQAATSRGGAELLGDNMTPSGRLEVAKLGDSSNLGLDVDDVLSGATVGPIDYSTFGGYVLEATQLGTVTKGNLARVVAPRSAGKQLSIATYNVENLSPKDTDAKFQALAQGVVHNLASPDIVALEEIQDNTGPTDDGTVAADQTLNELIQAIQDAGGPTYSYREIDPVNDLDGGQPGGNIRNAFLFNKRRVKFVDLGSKTVDRSTTGTDVTTYNGRAGVTLSPGRIDPTNSVWDSSRKPLVGEFRFKQQPVIVVANHFDSKGGDQSADGRFQYPAQSSRMQRSGQASMVHDFVQQVLATQATARVVVVGDLNDYQFSPPLYTLETGTADNTGTPILSDLITTLPTNQQYTYVFDGVSQVLDHILVTPQITNYRYQVVHINSEYSNQVSDHDPQVVNLTP